MMMTRRREGYREKRKAIAGVAWKLFSSRGYDLTSVDMIVEEAGISKGTFYHYFGSKEELLDAVVDQMTYRALEHTRKEVERPGLSAVERLNLLFIASRQWRFENITLVREVVEILYRDENLRLLHKTNERSLERTVPILEKIIDQGIEEGCFSTPDSQETACMILEMLRSAGRRIMEVYQGESGRDLAEECAELERRVNVYPLMMERMLCAEPGSLERIDRSVFEEGIRAFRRE